MADLEINDVSMSFVDRSGKGLLALDRISLAIEDSEFVCLTAIQAAARARC